MKAYLKTLVKAFWSLSAERGGFEPPKRFWRLHAFQACLFSHSSTSPWLCESFVCYALAIKSLRPICIAESAAKVTQFFHRIGKKIPFFMGFFPFCRGGALLSLFRVAEKRDCSASLPNTANDNAQVPMPCWACGALYIMYASVYPFIWKGWANPRERPSWPSLPAQTSIGLAPSGRSCLGV